MSSPIIQAKAEVQKLINQYEKLQIEAKTAKTSEEAARKVAQADTLIAQISTLQSTITNLQAKNRKATATHQTTSSAAAQAAVNKRTHLDLNTLEERIDRLEIAQKKTRAQIEQLTRTRAELLTRLKYEAQKNVGVLKYRANDEKLQQELTKLIKEKESEYQVLKQELKEVHQKAQKEAELLKIQRDAARALIAKQKQLKLEKKQLSIPQYRKGNKGGLKGELIIISLIVFFLVMALLTPLWTSKKIATSDDKYQTSPKKSQIDSQPVVKEVTAVKLKPLSLYRDRLKYGERGPLMVKLPGGRFKMGSKNTLPFHDERPQHEVQLQSFSISRYEITFEEYDPFAKATGHPLPLDRGWGREKRPVINVNWYEATSYTQWLTVQTGHQYRLPSEREWEYAARAGAEIAYGWEYKVSKNQANCSLCGSQWDGKKTAPVGRFQPNAFGIYDTIGNVMEWTLSCFHASYRGAPLIGNHWKGGDCSQRMARSSAYNTSMNNLRITKRNQFGPTTRIDSLGFRVVRVD